MLKSNFGQIMKIDPYNFLFHPLHEEHQDEVKGISIVTNVLLTVFSSGLYLLVVGAVHAYEWMSGNEASPADGKAKEVFDKHFPLASRTKTSYPDFVGIPALKQKHREYLKQLTGLAHEAEKKPILWRHFQRRTSDPISQFDAVMLPTSEPSDKHGDQYRLSKGDLDILKSDPQFMKSYRKGIVVIGKGLCAVDLEKVHDLTSDQQRYTGNSTRLKLMLQSLTEFGVKDLHENLVAFIRSYEIEESLDQQTRDYMRPIQ